MKHEISGHIICTMLKVKNQIQMIILKLYDFIPLNNKLYQVSINIVTIQNSLTIN